jgi:CRISPR-associated protein Cmr3
MDLVSKKHQETENKEAFRLDFVQREFSSNITTEKILITHHPDLEYRAGALLDSGTLKNYLLAEMPDTLKYRPIYQQDYLTIEPKVGIERNLSQSEDKEGRLYRIDMMRLKVSHNYRLLVDLVNIDLPKNGLIKLGGENRAFSYEQTELDIFNYTEEDKKQVIDSINAKKKFRLYCTTPIIWNKNASAPAWKASWMDGDKYPGTDIKCKIITAALGKHIHIGGWDIANKCPKKMYRAVPAGAVYYLELLSGTGDAVFDTLHYQNISLERANEGFGLTLVGIY